MRSIATLLIVAILTFFATSAHGEGNRVSGSRYGEWVRINHNGVITYRYAYRGYKAGFPPPAMYYYGYPQSGFSYGIGF